MSLSTTFHLLKNASRIPAAATTRSTIARRYSSTMHDNDPDTLEREKQRNLSNTQHKTSTPHKHAPGWNEHLASTSEASVKADKAPGSVFELQESTVEYIRSRHSPDDRMGPTTAYYPRDEVSGPLGDAKGVERDQGQKVLKHKTTVREEETTDILKSKPTSTSSEENVKADRGEI
ncbi:hypothetical protein BD779DRAFT_1495196 [Infundibulicybe gibba]|nr:hypothetical protein BD779DRAFT_1495196 [Infundibulicybe gibba]